MNDEKSEIQSSKFETNSKSEIPRFKTAGALVLPGDCPGFEFCVLVI
jgi:hypothetical protein